MSYELDKINSNLEDYLKNDLSIKLNFPHGADKNSAYFLCPVHQEKHPSALFDPKIKAVHCYGACGKTYNLISLYAQKNGMSNNDAIEALARKYNIQPIQNKALKTQSNTTAMQEKKYDDLTNQYEAWNKVLNEKLPNGFRGISIETLNRFTCGYLENFMEKGKVLGDYIVMPNSKYSYNSRHIDHECNNDDKCRKPKDVPQVPFNIKALTEQKPCFLVEGEFDAMSIIECGYNAIAVSGQPTNTLYDRVKECNNTTALIVALDMDRPEIVESANKCVNTLKELGANAYIPELNDKQAPRMYLGCKDANEAFLKDRDAFKAELDRAVACIELERQKAKDEYIEENSDQSISIGFYDRMKSSERHAITTGFDRLDRKLDGGLFQGLYILGGTTGTGKTSFAMQIANHIARNDIDVMIIALEMGKNELVARNISRLTYMLSNKSEKHSTIVRHILNPHTEYTLNQKQKETLYLAEDTYSAYATHLYTIEGTGDINVKNNKTEDASTDIRTKISEHTKRLGQAPVLIVDYLQILAPTNDHQSDKWNIDKSMLELKRISRDFNIPVIAISSLNRETYKETKDKTNNRITLASFKESGSIEYGSDVVIALDKSSDDEVCTEKMRIIDVNILKNRNGATGHATKLAFHTWFNYMEETN